MDRGTIPADKTLDGVFQLRGVVGIHHIDLGWSNERMEHPNRLAAALAHHGVAPDVSRESVPDHQGATFPCEAARPLTVGDDVIGNNVATKPLWHGTKVG